MVGYKPYPEYKDSGVEWLGEVPVHWDAIPLRHILTEPFSNGIFKKREHWGEGIKVVNVFDVYRQDNIVHEPSLDRVACDQTELEKYSVKHGDFLFVRSSLKLEGIGKSASVLNPVEPLVFECHLVRGRPDIVKVDPKFLCYFLNSGYSRESLISLSNQVTMTTLDQQKFKQLDVSMPSIMEQQTIARFLDYKTAQIDALLVRKELLLERLAEKRTALISHAITKGLNPQTKMKDSGVEWLGEVPEHWGVIRLRFVVSKIEQGWSPQCENQPADEDEWGVLKVGCVNGEDFDFSENKALPGDLQPKTEYEIKAGDILMSRANTKELLGSAALVHEVRSKLILCDKLYRFVSGGNISNRYLVHVLRSSLSRYQYEREATGASGSMQNIGQDTVKNLTFTLPPFEEQLEIVGQLGAILSRIESTKELVTAAIVQLKEYRSALITHAVTGKIDVRAVEVPEPIAKGQAA